MANLLRSPAVLIAVLLAVYWAFGPTPSGKKNELGSDQQEDKLVLRIPTKEPEPPLPPAKERRKGPARAAIRATEPHQLTSSPGQTKVADDTSSRPIHATIRGITPVPEDSRSSQPAPPSPPQRPSQEHEPRHVTHIVVDGDDLKRLALKYLGDAERYYEIFEANPDILTRPDVLPVGKTLRIPITN
jgi:nucleoid-associated protein YgaU